MDQNNVVVEITKGMTIVIIMLIILWYALSDVRASKRQQMYFDCSESFKPDVPKRVKEACELRKHYEQDMVDAAPTYRKGR